jgi:hypothetical protein
MIFVGHGMAPLTASWDESLKNVFRKRWVDQLLTTDKSQEMIPKSSFLAIATI